VPAAGVEASARNTACAFDREGMLASDVGMLFGGLVSSFAGAPSAVSPASLRSAGIFKSRSSDAALTGPKARNDAPTPIITGIIMAKLRTTAPPLQWRLVAKLRDDDGGPLDPKTGAGRRSRRRVSGALVQLSTSAGGSEEIPDTSVG
jgi:hypothetical protein